MLPCTAIEQGTSYICVRRVRESKLMNSVGWVHPLEEKQRHTALGCKVLPMNVGSPPPENLVITICCSHLIVGLSAIASPCLYQAMNNQRCQGGLDGNDLTCQDAKMKVFSPLVGCRQLCGILRFPLARSAQRPIFIICEYAMSHNWTRTHQHGNLRPF